MTRQEAIAKYGKPEIFKGIGRYINFYNARRLHSSHQSRTPDVVYFASLPQPSAEAA